MPDPTPDEAPRTPPTREGIAFARGAIADALTSIVDARRALAAVRTSIKDAPDRVQAADAAVTVASGPSAVLAHVDASGTVRDPDAPVDVPQRLSEESRRWGTSTVDALTVEYARAAILGVREPARPVCPPGRHRPDDDPRPGDRCKDCGADLTWRGPGPHDWDVADPPPEPVPPVDPLLIASAVAAGLITHEQGEAALARGLAQSTAGHEPDPEPDAPEPFTLVVTPRRLRSDRPGCLCCDGPHVFGLAVVPDLDSARPPFGAWTSQRDLQWWLHTVLIRHVPDGARARITVTIEPDPEPDTHPRERQNIRVQGAKLLWAADRGDAPSWMFAKLDDGELHELCVMARMLIHVTHREQNRRRREQVTPDATEPDGAPTEPGEAAL